MLTQEIQLKQSDCNHLTAGTWAGLGWTFYHHVQCRWVGTESQLQGKQQGAGPWRGAELRDQEESWERHEKDNICREVLEAEVLNTSQGKVSAKPRKLHTDQDWCWWARTDNLVHHCRGKGSLGKFFSHSSKRISAAPAIPFLSRNVMACEK